MHRLLPRKRRLLLYSSLLSLILIPSLIFTLGIDADYVMNDVANADDDAYDYEAIAGVHAMVHQMAHGTKTKREVVEVQFLTGSQKIRQQERHTYKLEEEKDMKKKHGFVETPSQTYVSSGFNRNPIEPGSLRRKIQDSDDNVNIPPEDVKGYSFLRENTEKPTFHVKIDKVENENDEMYEANEGDDDYGENDTERNDEKDIIIDDKDGEEDDYKEDGEDSYEYWNRNPSFKKGDFDELPKNYTKLQYETVSQSKGNNLTHIKYGENDDQRLLLVNTKNCDPKTGKCVLPSNTKPVSKQHNSDRVVQFSQNRPVNPQPVQNKTRIPTFLKRNVPLQGITNQQNSRNYSPNSQYYSQNSNERPRDYKKMVNNRRRFQEPHRGLNSVYDGEYAHALPLHEQPATQLQMPQVVPHLGSIVSNAGFPVVRDRIYWSKEVEAFVPKGVGQNAIKDFQFKISHQKVKELQPPQWNRCGRPKNQYIVMEDGSAACARYRSPHTKMLQGEILSFYLARLLELDSVPVCTLAEVNSTAPLWRNVKTAEAGWEDGQLVVLIQWIEGLDKQWSQVKMPPLILSAYQRGATVDQNHPALVTMAPLELSELLQWSDLIVYDYVIGHYDRVASMQDGAEREQKQSIMSESIRNLRKVPLTNKLWFVDNESGLFDGYELMKYGKKNGPRFIKFHKEILQTICIFRKSMIENIIKLAQNEDPQALLEEFTKRYEPLYKKLPNVSKIKYFKKFFHSRLKDVENWIEKCRSS